MKRNYRLTLGLVLVLVVGFALSAAPATAWTCAQPPYCKCIPGCSKGCRFDYECGGAPGSCTPGCGGPPAHQQELVAPGAAMTAQQLDALMQRVDGKQPVVDLTVDFAAAAEPNAGLDLTAEAPASTP